jgi:DNA repair exonuclease SbcCD ATPase subunit
MYGYGNVGMGYRYPRRSRKAYIGADNAKAWTKAAIFNTAVANNNPWVNFLRNNGYYQKISNLLQEARSKYYVDIPASRENLDRKIETLERQLESLKEEQGVINQNYADLEPLYNQKYNKYLKTYPYAKAYKDTISKLDRDIANIEGRINLLRKLKEAPMVTEVKSAPPRIA